ncbi:unnamed protein product [Didymodactylos carnosus]|nr:unnamed protein product [Didymodactylos carnosus]CAF3523288.1 unnamed protein product [Didymodactylos carnosus]
MALALLSTPEQLKSDQKGMNGVLNQLLQLTIGAAKGSRHRCGGIHVSEPLAVLAKLFVVEERTIDYILCHAETKPPSDMSSTIRLFASLLLTFRSALDGNDPLKQFTLIAVLNILWSISFQAQYSRELIASNDELISIVKSLAESDDKKTINQYKPRSMEGIKEAARGILLNLDIDINDSSKTKEEIQKDKSNALTALSLRSYSHRNKEFCVKVLELLSTRNDVFDIWIDQTHCQSVGDLWESIADGMEQAQIIVCLISKHYYESKSCRQEFQYATDTLHKSIVPAFLEDFEPRSWLGIRISGVKYIRFRNLAQPDKAKMADLLDTILASFAASSSSSPEVLSAVQHSSKQHQSYEPEITHDKNSTIDSLRLPNEQWSTATIDDINNWFIYHHISSQIRNLYNFQTGQDMLHYAQMLVDDYEQQFQIYSKAFRKKTNDDELLPHEFDRFKRAMEKLLKDNTISLPSSMSTKYERVSTKNPATSKSSTCCIL